MGFDPRRWRPAPGSPPVTSNVDALLAENDALRREVQTLRRRLEQFSAQPPQPGPDGPTGGPTYGHGLSPDQLERWGQAMAAHPQWQALRIGPPGGLRGVIEELRRHWSNPALSLEQELERRSPGLGTALAEALRGPHSRARWAMRNWRLCLGVCSSAGSSCSFLPACTWWASSISSAAVSRGTRPMVLRYQPIESALTRPPVRGSTTLALAGLAAVVDAIKDGGWLDSCDGDRSATLLSTTSEADCKGVPTPKPPN